MKNTEGLENYCEWLRDKGKRTSNFNVQCDAKTGTGTKKCIEKTG